MNIQRTQHTRLLLCTKDMMLLTGKSKATIWRMRQIIRERSRKNKRCSITVGEFCEQTGLKEEAVLARLD